MYEEFDVTALTGEPCNCLWRANICPSQPAMPTPSTFVLRLKGRPVWIAMQISMGGVQETRRT